MLKHALAKTSIRSKTAKSILEIRNMIANMYLQNPKILAREYYD